MSLSSVYARLVTFGQWLAHATAWIPPSIARVAVGWVFIESGWGKLHNLAGVTSYFRDLGIPMAEFQAPMAAATELICGAALLIGLFTRLAAIPLIVIMGVAIWTAQHEFLTSEKSWSDLFGLSEFLYIAVLAWLAVHGGGFLSIDRLLEKVCGKHCATKSGAKPAA